MNRVGAYTLVIALTLALSTCGFSPKTGYYHGTNPEVSFEIARFDNGQYYIINFTTLAPPIIVHGVSYSYSLDELESIPINPDGSFTNESASLTGKIDGGAVTGQAAFAKDMIQTSINGISTWIVLEKRVYNDINWTASWSGTPQAPTSIPTLLPPKLGHFLGTNPDVSFDVTDAGIEHFTVTGGCNTGIGPGTFSLTDGGIISIATDGSVSYKSYYEVTGKVSGDFAAGQWSVTSCTRDNTSYSPDIGIHGNWIAYWVSP